MYERGYNCNVQMRILHNIITIPVYCILCIVILLEYRVSVLRRHNATTHYLTLFKHYFMLFKQYHMPRFMRDYIYWTNIYKMKISSFFQDPFKFSLF